MSQIIAWWSAGITSAIACKLAIDTYGLDNVKLIYFKIDTAHEDNFRFQRDCENWFGKEIEVYRSDKYKDQFEVISQKKFVNSPYGAPCTNELKKKIRQKIEKEIPYTNQVFGFEYSKKEVNRALRFKEQYPHTNPLFPLIDAKLTKEDCLQLLYKQGIEIPAMYKLGYTNNNCFTGRERYITQEGLKAFQETEGTEQMVLTSEGWKKGVVKCFGTQNVWVLKVKRNNTVETIETTRDHGWIVPRYKNQSQGIVITTTEHLPIGKTILPNYSIPDYDLDKIAIMHGFVFGDGTLYKAKTQVNTYAKIQFCGDKKELALKIFSKESSSTIHGLNPEWKSLPKLSDSQEYKLGFLAGLVAADGCVVRGGISISNKSAAVITAIAEIVKSIGLFVSSVRTARRDTNYKKDAELSTLVISSISFKKEWLFRSTHQAKFTEKPTNPKGFEVISVERTDRFEKVYCLTVPDVHNFTLANGMLTRNCKACVKGGMGYWNKIRIDFPDLFEKMASLEQTIGRSCIKGVFLRDLEPTRGRYEPLDLPDCGTFCEIEFADIEHDQLKQYI